MFRKFLDFLTGKGGIATTQKEGAVGRLNLLDPKRIKDIFNVDKVAQDNGKNEIPSSQAVPPEPLEEEINSHLKALEIEQGVIMSSRIQSYQRSLQSLSADLDLKALEMERQTILGEANATVKKSIVDLYGLERLFKAADSHLKEFIKEHKLEKKAPQNQGNAILKVGILFFIFLIETLINTTFISSALKGAVYSSFSYAILISSINLIFPFLMAWKVAPYKNSIYKYEVILAWVGLAFMLVVIFFANLGAGHLREVIQSATSAQLKGNLIDSLMMQKLLSSLVIFDLGTTWGFIFLGFMFAAFAFFDGYNFDDPYPNFGKLWRNAEKVTTQMQDYYADAIDDISDLFGDFNIQFQTKLESIDARKKNFSDFTQGINTLKVQFDAFQTHINSVYSSVVSDYRTINKKFRKTSIPKYFASSPKYYLTYHIDNLPNQKFFNDINSILQEAHRELPKMIKQMSSEHKKLLEKIPNLNQIKEMV